MLLRRSNMDALTEELKELIVSTLGLPDVNPDSIDPQAPLFGQATEGLGLDSIDALELAVAISKRYGVRLKAEEKETEQAFASLSALAAYIESKRSS